MLPNTSLVYSPEDGYCFAYPVRFHRTEEHGPVAIYGPTHGPGPDPLAGSLRLEITRLQAGQTLDAVVDAFLTQFSDVPLPEDRHTIEIDNKPAQVLETVPGMLGSRDVFVIHNETVFHLTFWPAPSLSTVTATDVEDLYETVLQSFQFLP